MPQRPAREILRLIVLGAALATAMPATAANPGYLTTDEVYDPRALRALAEQGDKRAAFLLGSRFASGHGGPRDDSEAVRWFRAAAESGLAEAQYNLGVMYAAGRGVPRDLAQAAVWYERAAQQGLAEAQFNLGTLYGLGQGVPRDDKLAAKWLERAARKGVAEAQYNLAALYERGRGVRLDGYKALEWYQRAADQGFERAKVRHAVLARKLGVTGSTAPTVRVPAEAPAREAVPAVAAAAEAPPADTGAAATVAEPPASGAPAPGGIGEAWVRTLDPEHYTLQLASYTEEADARRFAGRFPEDTPMGIYHSTKRGKVWFSVVQGDYPSYEAAVSAEEDLPASIRKMKPWVRKIALIQKEMD